MCAAKAMRWYITKEKGKTRSQVLSLTPLFRQFLKRDFIVLKKGIESKQKNEEINFF